eukprot:SAG31_NODE_1308_length_8879_cov_3.158884_6_plen_70_part_00
MARSRFTDMVDSMLNDWNDDEGTADSESAAAKGASKHVADSESVAAKCVPYISHKVFVSIKNALRRSPK